eukprot:CAMPEP_0185763404 /NCGR_PEP_ID=MMETSP1174-20130828/22337_1 /TAXON_ID=35687 /ORGANISM="Dictyocha speculum, Strain CCMP1381" /LENGTH=38 /DNA_ID= /DNA_START= /DNA_END= /DNA_ORIENTATION=
MARLLRHLLPSLRTTTSAADAFPATIIIISSQAQGGGG